MLFELRQSLTSPLNAIRNTKNDQPSLKNNQPINVGTEKRHPVLRDRYKQYSQNSKFGSGRKTGVNSE